MAWSSLETYNFSGLASSSTIPAPTTFASPSTGQAWTDLHGGVWSIANGGLQGVTDTTDETQYKRDLLLAGTSTDAQDQQMSVTFPYKLGFYGIYCVFRFQRSSAAGSPSAYLVYYGNPQTVATKPYAAVYSMSAGNNTLLGGPAALAAAPSPGDIMQLSGSAVGTLPTVITITITNTTTGISTTTSFNDSTSVLQNPGPMGLDITNAVATAPAETTPPISAINTYYKTAQPPTTSLTPLPQPNIFFPAQGWDQSTSGHAITNVAGNYLKANFTNSASTTLSINININQFSNSMAETLKPILCWSIDGAVEQDLQLTSANSSGGVVTLAANLAAGTHTLQLWVKAACPFVNHWNLSTSNTCVDIMGFSANPGTLMFNPVTNLLPGLALFYGDSMTEGEGINGLVSGTNQASYLTYDDATRSYVPALANALNCEYSVAAFGGQGWTSGAADGVTPGLTTTYSSIYSGITRSFAGLSFVTVNMGTNGNSIGGAGTVSTFLTHLRSALTAAGSTAKIILFVPWSGSAEASLIADFTTYQGVVTSTSVGTSTIYMGSHDAKCVLIDLHNPCGLPVPAASNSAGSLYSYDTTHLSAYGNQRVLPLISQAVQAALATPGRSYSFS